MYIPDESEYIIDKATLAELITNNTVHLYISAIRNWKSQWSKMENTFNSTFLQQMLTSLFDSLEKLEIVSFYVAIKFFISRDIYVGYFKYKKYDTAAWGF